VSNTDGSMLFSLISGYQPNIERWGSRESYLSEDFSIGPSGSPPFSMS
jgi:hypothetical protein